MLMHVLHPMHGGMANAKSYQAMDSDAVHHQWVTTNAGARSDTSAAGEFPSTPSFGQPVVQPFLQPHMMTNAGQVGMPVMWTPQGAFMFFGNNSTKRVAAPEENTKNYGASTSSPESKRVLSHMKEESHAGRRQRQARPSPTTEDALTSEEIEEMKLAVQSTVRKLQNPHFAEGLGSLLPNIPCFQKANGQSNVKEMEKDSFTSKSSTRATESRQVSSEDAEDDCVNFITAPGAWKTTDIRSASDAEIDRMFAELESSSPERQKIAIEWVVSLTRHLSVTRRGCRIVQRAMEVAGSEDQERIVENMEGFVLEAVESPHANYVLQKCFEIMPPHKLQFVLRELKGQGAFVARHRFGCRIIQRAMEHCDREQKEDLIAEILMDAPQLVRHTYGNFVVQHILQYGTPEQVHQIADVLLADAIRFAKHRIASHVMSCALSSCSPEDVRSLTELLMGEEGQLADLTRRHYGSFVVREVNRVSNRLRDEAK